MGRREQGRALIGGVLGASLLAACAAGGVGEPGPSRASTASPPAAGEVTIANYAFLPIDAVLDEHARESDVAVGIALPGPSSSSARPTAVDDLAAGGDLADVVLVGDDAVGAVVANADRFVDLNTVGVVPADTLPWAAGQGTHPDGRVLAVPLTASPTALCFRRDLLADAGIAEDRTTFAAALAEAGGDWATYLDLGRRYHAATGRAWFDHPLSLWDAMVRQLPHGLSTPGREPDIATDPELRRLWGLLTAAVADGLSAHQSLWDWNSGASFIDGSFATAVCPEWMLGVMEGYITGADGTMPAGWDVAEAFPGGPVGWGSTFVAVSAAAEDPNAALALVARLTDSEVLADLRAAGAGLPASSAALAELAASDEHHSSFGDTPTAAIYARLAPTAVPHVPGPDDARVIQQILGKALADVDRGARDGASAWAAATAQLTGPGD